MSFTENVRHPIESFRTAPEAISRTLAWLGGVAYGGYEVIENAGNAYNAWGMLAGASWAAACGLIAHVAAEDVGAQFEYRERIEGALQRKGFNPRIMNITTTEWCDRQTAIVACEQTGHQGEYLNFIDQQKVTLLGLQWLPHIYRTGKGGQAELPPAPAE